MSEAATGVSQATDGVKLIGIGRAGVSIVDRILGHGHGAFSAAVIDTDSRTVSASGASMRILAGERTARGMGTGGDPATGRKIAEHEFAQLKTAVAGARVVCIVAGLGGGTGSGVLPVLVQAAHDAGAMTLCFVSMPFLFEGAECAVRADAALEEVVGSADVTVVVRNEDVCETSSGDIKLKDAFDKADEALAIGAYSLLKLVSQEGLIGLGFSDLHAVLEKSGDVYSMGYGWSAGPGRAESAARAALESPLLGQGALVKAEAILVGIIGDSSLTIRETDRIIAEVRDISRRTSGISMGAVVDDGVQDKLLVTIMISQKRPGAPGRQAAEVSQPAPAAARKPSEGKQPVATQGDLLLDSTHVDRGRFKDSTPTIRDGEDLDLPTFFRRHLHFER